MQTIQPSLHSRKSGTAQKIMVARLGGVGKSTLVRCSFGYGRNIAKKECIWEATTMMLLKNSMEAIICYHHKLKNNMEAIMLPPQAEEQHGGHYVTTTS